jgi:hypothetical protein
MTLGVLTVGVLSLGALALIPKGTHDLASAAIADRIGLTPEVLLASGLTPTDGGVLAARIRDAADQRAQLDAAEGALAVATQQVSTAESQLTTNPSNPTAVSAAQDARARVRAARETLRNAKSAVFAAATAGLSAETVAAIKTCRAASGRHVPAEFMAAHCDATAWPAIESAVVAEQRAVQRGEAVPDPAASLLQQIRAQPAVMQAAQAIANQLGAMRDALQS